MLREAIFRRFGETRAHAQGIEFLSDNGPEYMSHRFRPFVRALGLIPCHTPRRSPQWNGLAEAFFGSFKRNYVYQACLDTLDTVGRGAGAGASEDLSLQPRGAAQRHEHAVAGRILCGVVSQKQDTTSPQLSGAVQRA